MVHPYFQRMSQEKGEKNLHPEKSLGNKNFMLIK